MLDLPVEDYAEKRRQEVAEARTQPLKAHGDNERFHVENNHVDIINMEETQGGTSKAYLLRRLARDRPDVLSRVWGRFAEFAADIKKARTQAARPGRGQDWDSSLA